MFPLIRARFPPSKEEGAWGEGVGKIFQNFRLARGNIFSFQLLSELARKVHSWDRGAFVKNFHNYLGVSSQLHYFVWGGRQKLQKYEFLVLCRQTPLKKRCFQNLCGRPPNKKMSFVKMGGDRLSQGKPRSPWARPRSSLAQPRLSLAKLRSSLGNLRSCWGRPRFS